MTTRSRVLCVGAYRVRIGAYVGKGRYGWVNEAHAVDADGTSFPRFAIKFSREEARRARGRELAALHRLEEAGESDHVLRMLDYCVVEDVSSGYIETRLLTPCYPTTLRAYVGAAMREDRWVDIVQRFSDVAYALLFLRRACVVHNDIKCDNVCVDENDQAVLIDFGMANVLSEEDDGYYGTACGTPTHWAPEKFTSMHRRRGVWNSYATDVFSMACMMYECVHDAPLYPPHNTKRELGALVVSGDHLKWNCEPLDLLRNVVFGMWAPDPAERLVPEDVIGELCAVCFQMEQE